ncbi:DNA topoisomerase [Burkholderia sp. Ac-20345]|uniref:DNA topoisomerase n=1 Tax=Burkholderia sp. Ac-20345 TaxID=2703891 RepID=UPI00197B175E|nr:DNA topoisomerase [Burkholderia sp. Ac-20345]MBN3780512.1 DNA topoisomerase [Burkholderia sp. Ac-20345]
MGLELIVAEKPSVAKDIAEALGGFTKRDGYFERDDLLIGNAVGHCAMLVVPEGMDPGHSLRKLPCIPPYFDVAPIERNAEALKKLASLIKRRDVTTITNACDAGREGELIFALIVQYVGTNKPMRRMWLQTMTPAGIRAEFENRRDAREYAGLEAAARCRNEADFLVGVNATRALSKLSEFKNGVRDLVNAGRVQTPVLTIVVDLEARRKAFKSRPFWKIVGTFGTAAGEYQGVWFDPEFKAGDDENARDDRLFQQATATAIAAECKHLAVTSVVDEGDKVVRNQPKLFDLTSLQREANTKFDLSAANTLVIAQSLYEKHKVLTYPRTDSNALPEDFVATVLERMEFVAKSGDVFGPLAEHAAKAVESGYVRQDKRIFNNAKISDHFAIIPTGVRPGSLSDAELKVFQLVVQRFVATFFPPAEFSKTTRTTQVGRHVFQSVGKVLVDAGWMAVTGREADDDGDGVLVAVGDGESVAIAAVETKESKTKAPPRFNEATLLAAMEGAGKYVEDDDLRDAMKARGLGTPATRDKVIEGLLATKDGKGNPRDPYLVREGKELVPTAKGMGTIDFLRANGVEQLCTPALTGEWERRLSEVEAGRETRDQFMGDIKSMATQVVDTIRHKAESLPEYKAAMVVVPCPACGGQVLPEGSQYVCTGCDFRIPVTLCQRRLTRPEVEAVLRGERTALLEGFVSPKSGKPFSAHLKYSSAKNEVAFEFPPPPDSGHNCPSCNATLVHWQKPTVGKKKGYNFWGCSNRDSCKVTMNDKGGAPDYTSMKTNT